MAKRCIICDGEAGFRIRDGNEFYCEECAENSFGDVGLLEKINEFQQRNEGL